MRYELHYWPGIPGRGEFVRLALEDAGASYIDTARASPEGMAAMERLLDDASLETPPFAPPFLKAGPLLIGQTGNILLYLGGRHGLAPKSERGRLWVHQLQLTVADLVAEVHDSHHPISGELYYKDQKKEAAKRAKDLRENRLPKFLGYFDRVLAANPKKKGWLAGAQRSYADLSLFHLIEGLRYAFPNAMHPLDRKHPRLGALHDRVAARPRIAAYATSGRKQPFNEDGIFRHYPELDP